MTCRRRAGPRGPSWFYTLELGRDAAGKRIQRTRRGFPTKKACDAERAAELVDRRRGTHVEPSREPLATYLARWLTETAGNHSPATHYAYAVIVRTRIVPALGTVPLGALDALTLSRFYRTLGECYAPTTVTATHTCLRAALRQAVRWRLIPRAPTDDVTVPGGKAKVKVVWSAEEARRFLASETPEAGVAGPSGVPPTSQELVQSPQSITPSEEDARQLLAWKRGEGTGAVSFTRFAGELRGNCTPVAGRPSDPCLQCNMPLFRFLLDSLCRLGEALALTWADLDLDHGTVWITATRSIGSDGKPLTRLGTKAGASRRIELMPETNAALRQHRTAQLEQRLRCGPLWHDQNLVFERGDGRHYHPDTVRTILRRACLAAGVSVVTPHALRHTGATLAVAQGVPLHAVMTRLGHANIGLTANLYAHASPEADHQVAEALRRALEG